MAQSNSQSTSGAGSGASSEAEQSFATADLRAGVKLQAGQPAKISVRGISGKPLSGGRSARSVRGIGGEPGGATGAGADNSGSERIDNSQTGLGSGADGSGDGEPDVMGFISVQLRDSDSNPLANTAYALNGPQQLAGTTDDQGQLSHPNVPLEYYELSIDGFANVHLPSSSSSDELFVAHLDKA